ncbi:MAG: SPOR domain-containing protein [Bacteroidales bacterium]|nr:SPOR domain-containing protein [Bacteroidales bacterium]
MKKITFIALIAVLAVGVSSCDFVRSIAGRPTSDELGAGVAAPGETMQYELLDTTVAAACACDSLCCADSLCCKENCCTAEGACCCKGGECCKEYCCCKGGECCKENCCCKAEACGECPKEDKCGECKKAEECGECAEAPKCEAVQECNKCEETPAPVAKPAPAPKAKKAPAARIFRGPVCKKAALENKYYVVIGTFKVEANACAQAKRAEKAGYKVVTIPFTNCLTAVTVAPTDDKAEALKSLEQVKTKKFCPADAYVLVVK